MHAGFWFLICYLLKAFDNFKSKEIAESIYEGAVEHFDEKLLEQMLTVLVTSGKLE